MASMQAVVFEDHGGPDMLEWKGVDRPEPGPGEALVEIRAAGINHLDIWCREGLPGVEPMPHIPGNDGAGVVRETGPGVDAAWEGEEVIIAPGVPGGWSKERLQGDENLAGDYHVLGYASQGTHAEYVVVPEVCLMEKPDGLSLEEAGCYALTFLTAWHMLGEKRADLELGEEILVIGGSSGVGSAALQIAGLKGASLIITTAGKHFDRKAELCRNRGADYVINHEETDDLSDEVRELTGGRGVHVAFEHVGPAVFNECVQSLRRGGRLVTCGATSGPEVEIDLRQLFAKHLTYYGNYMGSQSELVELNQFIRSGELSPFVDETFPMSRAKEAHQYIEDRKQFGKVVLIPDGK